MSRAFRPVITWPTPGATAREVIADLRVLEAALDGTGPAVAVPGALPASSRPSELPGLSGPTATVRVPEACALVAATSGTTGVPKPALLTAEALRGAVAGVHEVFGGPGRWLLAVAPTHISGISVVLRALAAGHAPAAVAPGGFTAEAFARATRSLGGSGGRRYVMLVPTQLRRVLAAPEGVAAARTYDVVLSGGAPLPGPLRERAQALGVQVVDGYGCSETTGGCVYDGRPLPGMTATLGEEGRIHLGGPQVALGYLDRPDLAGAFTTDDTGVRWYRTDDHGECDDAGRLHVVGRLDDLINTGGLKVAPTVVEEALARACAGAGPARLGLADAMVVGVPDEEWGETVAVLAVPGEAAPPRLGDIRAALADHLPGHALPRVLHLVDALPLRGPGKPDRAAARALVTGSAPRHVTGSISDR